MQTPLLKVFFGPKSFINNLIVLNKHIKQASNKTMKIYSHDMSPEKKVNNTSIGSLDINIKH